MKKYASLPLALSALVLLTYSFGYMSSASAETAKPVELVGDKTTQDTDTPKPAPVDSALTESIETEAAPVKPVAGKALSKHHKSKTTEDDATGAAAGDVDPNYNIHPGDVLQITVWKEDNMDREVLVLPDGTISFPLIGAFNVEGFTPAKVQSIIKEKLRTLIPGASVTVLVKATLGHTVSVIGQVQKPGELVMGHHLTVMQALSQAGGLTPYGSESKIIILRHTDGKEVSIPFPYDDIISGNNLDKDITLQPGDVVVVPTASLF